MPAGQLLQHRRSISMPNRSSEYSTTSSVARSINQGNHPDPTSSQPSLTNKKFMLKCWKIPAIERFYSNQYSSDLLLSSLSLACSPIVTLTTYLLICIENLAGLIFTCVTRLSINKKTSIGVFPRVSCSHIPCKDSDSENTNLHIQSNAFHFTSNTMLAKNQNRDSLLSYTKNVHLDFHACSQTDDARIACTSQLTRKFLEIDKFRIVECELLQSSEHIISSQGNCHWCQIIRIILIVYKFPL